MRAIEIPDFTLLIGTETNVLPDGSLDYDDELLGELDWVVASVHTSFRMPEEEMTARMVAAIEHPLVDAIGHPTGRMLGKREGYRIDLDAVIEAAARTGTFLEINANPNRRDLPDTYARAAAEAGVTLVIDSDAHGVDTLVENMRFGVATARRAWLTAEQVANTRTLAGARQAAQALALTLRRSALPTAARPARSCAGRAGAAASARRRASRGRTRTRPHRGPRSPRPHAIAAATAAPSAARSRSRSTAPGG